METVLLNQRVPTLAEFLAAGSHKITWAIDGILPEQGVCILAGPPGCGKSWLLHDLAIEFARDGKWVGHFNTSGGGVLYLDEESTTVLFRTRFTKLLSAKGLPAKELPIRPAIGHGVNLSKQKSLLQLNQLMTNLKPRLVIIDSLIRFHSVEENSASDMLEVFAAIKTIVRKHSCSFVIADHIRKPNPMSSRQESVVRGSSDKAAFVDSLLSIAADGDAAVITPTKSRFGRPVPSFAITIDDLNDFQTVVKYAGEVSETQRTSSSTAAEKLVNSLLAEEGELTRQKLVEHAREGGISEKKLDSTLKLLCDNSTIQREDRKSSNGRGGPAAVYRLQLSDQ
jgi:predicted ATP-dependent serine protease